MTGSKTGEFTAMLNLEKGKIYEFRYLVDGKDWYNDPQADYYVANGYGEENGVFIADEQAGSKRSGSNDFVAAGLSQNRSEVVLSVPDAAFPFDEACGA